MLGARCDEGGSMRTVVQAKSWPSPRFRYSPLIAAGPFLKTAGMVALDSATGQLEKGGPGAETAKIFAPLAQCWPNSNWTRPRSYRPRSTLQISIVFLTLTTPGIISLTMTCHRLPAPRSAFLRFRSAPRWKWNFCCMRHNRKQFQSCVGSDGNVRKNKTKARRS